MSDDWIDKEEDVSSIFSHSCHGSFYLYSINASAHQNTAEYIADTLDNEIQQKGENNIAQVDSLRRKQKKGDMTHTLWIKLPYGKYLIPQLRHTLIQISEMEM